MDTGSNGQAGGDAVATRRLEARARRALTAVPLVVALVLAAGCSALSLAWGYLDNILVERVDDWVALQPGQRERLERRLQPWLRQVALERVPVYAAFLRELAARNEGGLEPADTRWAYRRLRGYYRGLMDDATGWIAPLLAGLDGRQLEHLEARMREKNAEYRERYLEVARATSRRALAERLVEIVERWTGPLGVDQVELLHQRTSRLPDTSAEWYGYRLRMQARLLARVRGGADAEAVRAHLRDWWIERAGLSAAERGAYRRFERELVALLAELAGTLSPLQRHELGSRLRDLASGLEAVASDARLAARQAAGD